MKVAAAASKKKHCKYCKFSGVFLPTTASLLAFQVLNRPLRRNHLTFISGLHAYLIMSCRYCICCLYTQYVVVVVAIAIAFSTVVVFYSYFLDMFCLRVSFLFPQPFFSAISHYLLESQTRFVLLLVRFYSE